MSLHASHFVMVLLPLQAICSLFALLLLILWWKKSRKAKRSKAPELAGAWPLIGHLHLLGGGRPLYQFLANMSDKYGPVFSFRFGARIVLVVSGWEVAKECLTTNDRVLASRPSSSAGKYMGYNDAIFTFSPYGPYWRELRKIVTLELLSNHRLEMLKHVRIREIDTCIGDLYKRSVIDHKVGVQPIQVEMKQWFGDLTFNVVVMIITGKRYVGPDGVGDKIEMQRFQAALSRFLYLAKGSAALIAFPFLEWIDFGGYKSAMKSNARDIDSVLARWVEEHRQRRRSIKSDSQADFIDVMMSLLEGTEFPNYDHDTVIKATCLGMILGGTDTTSTSLTWALSLLLNNKTELRKVQDELDVHVGKERHVNESDIQNLVYLQAVVKETLRLYPPVPMSVAHESTEDCNIAGFNIQAGTRVLFNLWKLHRDPRVWSDPLEFRPERFLLNHAHVDVRGQHFELIPFGSGRRSCPGISFGLQVLHLTLARLLQGFSIRMRSDLAVDMSENVGATIAKATPLEVLLTPRLSSECYGKT